MNTKPTSFQLEKIVPGTFLMQGLLGGVLGGFVAGVAAAMAWKENSFVMTLDLTSLAVFTGAIIGMIKAMLMWGLVRLTGIQYKAITRVTLTCVITCLSIAIGSRQANFDEAFVRGCLIWALAVGIPVALLVGSRVKPWELFTFGSIAAGEVDHRSGSRSILRTLATLPLRFLSIGATALLLVYITREVASVQTTDDVLIIILFLSVVCFYPLFSAYLTFRSPRKIVLVVIGVIMNFPMTLIWIIALREYLSPDSSNKLLIYVMTSGSFLAAWLMFLTARLSVKLSPAPSLSITSNKSIAAAPNLDHECLGSRFVEWQQRVYS